MTPVDRLLGGPPPEPYQSGQAMELTHVYSDILCRLVRPPRSSTEEGSRGRFAVSLTPTIGYLP